MMMMMVELPEPRREGGHLQGNRDLLLVVPLMRFFVDGEEVGESHLVFLPRFFPCCNTSHQMHREKGESRLADCFSS